MGAHTGAVKGPRPDQGEYVTETPPFAAVEDVGRLPALFEVGES
jgi:hypothetical protein